MATKPVTFLSFLQQKAPRLLLWLMPPTLFAFSVYYAKHLSMTHDECGSWTIWTDFPIFKCYAAPDCWGTANLHWLYVLLMKISVGWMGNSELAIRLPSLLAHLIYLFFSWKLVHSYTSSAWMALFGFILLNTNWYLLDFFSLARGYGLALAFLMMSLYFLAKFIRQRTLHAWAGALVGAFLSVLSNFTLLNYYVCLLAVLGGLFILEWLKRGNGVWKTWSVTLLFTTTLTSVMAWLIYRPIGFLKARGEFEYGATNFWETIHSLIRHSIYGKKYFNQYNVEFFAILLGLMLICATIYALKKWWKTPQDSQEQLLLAALILPFLASAEAILQHYLMDTKYQTGRTALMFIPLCAWFVFSWLNHWWQSEKSRLALGLSVALSIFCIVHFFRVAGKNYVAEWWYDAETKNMVLYMNEKIPAENPVKFGVNWLFHPATTFYIKTLHLHFADPPPVYSKEIRTDSLYDYYYVDPSDLGKLHPDYVLEKRFGYVGCLMKRKILPGNSDN